jgi:hypothetical protein
MNNQTERTTSMKGLQKETDSGTIYLSVKHHSICHESKTEQPNHVPVVAVEAMVCNIEWYEREHEGTKYRGFQLFLNADGTPCVLDIPFKSRACGRFMKLAENIDFTQPVEFSAWYDKKDDATAFNVKQGGKAIPQKYTLENPGELPRAEKDEMTGDLDFRAQTRFLLGRMKDVVMPAVEQAGNEMPELAKAATASAVAPDHAPQTDLSDDDIPF